MRTNKRKHEARMLDETSTYKKLYMKLAWEFCVFLLTVNIVASMYQAWENPLHYTKSPSKLHVMGNFSKNHNISGEIIDQLLSDMKKAREQEHMKDTSLGYTDAFILTLSLFCTIGWGHVYPRTSGGKIFCILGSCIGIPLTFTMIHSGAKILIRHVADIIRISHADNIIIHDKHIEKRINISTRAWLIPILISSLVIYIFLTALVIVTLGDFTYFDSLYYCFITLTTIGMGDFMQNNRASKYVHPTKSVVITLFLMFWTIFGITIIASIILALLSTKQNHYKVFQRDLCLKYDKRLVKMIKDMEETII